MTKGISNSTQRKIGVALSYVSMLCSVLISLFYHPFLFSHLGGSAEAATVQYGLNSFVSSLTSWMSLLSAALSSSYIRFATLAEKEGGEDGLKRTNGVYLSFFLVVAGVVMVAGAAFFVLLVTRAIPLDNYDDSSRGIIYKLAIIQTSSIVLDTPMIIATCFLTYRQRFIWQKAIAISASVLSPLVAMPFLLNGCSVLITSLISISISLAANVANLLYAIKRLGLKACFSKDAETKRLAHTVFGFCAVILFNSVVDQIESQIDKSILGFMTDASMVTIYTVGITFDSYLVTASYAFSNVYSTEINILVAKGDTQGLQRLFDRICKVELAIIFTAWGGFTACGQSFVVNWAGADKAQGYAVGVILMGLRSFALGCNPCIEVQRAMNKVKFRAVAYSIGAVANVGLSILLVYLFPREQAVFGCVIGTVISSVACKWIAMTAYNQHIGLDMRRYLLWYGLYILGAGAAVGLSYWISSYITFGGWKWTEPITRGALFAAFFLPVLIGYNWKWVKKFSAKIKNRVLR